MISFQIKNSGKTIKIDVDDEGIQMLVEKLTSLRGSGSHLHLRAFGPGRELGSETPWGETAVSEVIISHGGD